LAFASKVVVSRSTTLPPSSLCSAIVTPGDGRLYSVVSNASGPALQGVRMVEWLSVTRSTSPDVS
jgi:hypothetical protein